MTEAKKDRPDKGTDATLWAGVGVGIGSAALVAALLYANRKKVTQIVTRKTPIEHED